MIESLLISIAVVGVLLVLFLLSQVRKVNEDLRLKKHQSTEAGLADLLNYAAVVDDGVIVGKNGSFMAAWLYKGSDNASATDVEREMNSFRINQALANMGSGWMVHVDAVRRPAPNYSHPNQSNFPDPVSAAIDEERRRTFEGLGNLYEGFFIITVTWFPPMLAERKFVELMFHDDSDKPNNKARTHHLIDFFKKEVKNIESRMSSAVSMERLRGQKMMNEDGSTVTHDEFLQWLQFCVTGINHAVMLPTNPIYIDNLIGGKELYTGVTPKLGRKFIQVVAIEGFPLESSPGILTRLAELPVEYRWSNRFIFMDHHEAVSHLEKFRKKWKQKIRGFFDQVFNTNGGTVDEDAVSMVADAASAIAETNSGMVAQGFYTSVVVLMDESRSVVETAALQLEKAINAMAFTARVETINTMDAFMGSLPGHGVENVRRPLINTMNLADLIPTSTIWTGENFAPNPLMPPNSPPLMHGLTSGNSPFRVNIDVRDLGHTIMFGPTRAGKSTHLAILAMSWRRYSNARLFTFDKGMSMYPSCKAAGGAHYVVAGAGEKLAFAPLSNLVTRSRRAWAMGWIDDLLALNGLKTTPEQRNLIAETIIEMGTVEEKEGRPGTLSEFTAKVQDIDIRAALKDYTIDGLMGHLLDAEEDQLSISDFITFEIEHLMDLGDRYALPVLLYLFMRIQEALDGRPTLIILDEAWLMLGHDVFREKIREWLKTLAKKNCRVLMATQNLSDASQSGILDVIVESTATKIYLPNMYARDEAATALYLRMGLNLRQIEIIATAQQKRDYYLVSEKGRRLYSLALGPLALSFVGATGPDDIAIIKKLEEQHGDSWVHVWLRDRGLSLDNYRSAA
ncbi:conjugal transfer protein TrbE [Pseudomonas fragi]|uniref:VirB4 family type IV secretion/conjugal transfer ATPase n=1 Tax=Pseudomonas TaxID=286 RepID=UPI000E761DF4|nr:MULTISPECIES: conjugal transfer protein TrbE [Pseudomonas]AOA09201.1 conjugal transfer protein TrbE [Pseudomonas sp. TMW 2.1634]MBM1202369.1 conjugal transfer protein TrbE [Pseudomonas fragi]MDY7572654.1 conjugal transfer protein TrbE [Pseudomonas sp. CCC4.1]MEB0143212.1 conjugal transfer protein TrbE [Pseudomonas sp. CCC4.1]